MAIATTRELLTVGYEGTTIGAVLDTLRAAEVALLIDVRALPQSRKPGFAKRQLAAALDERGVRYVHLQALGTPKPGRDAVRAGDVAAMRQIFRAHMQGDCALADLAGATELTAGQRACLLCFERDHTECHRSIVAEMIASRTGQRIVHLYVDNG
jgi:uncharacterized protein (DUF488 family)